MLNYCTFVCLIFVAAYSNLCHSESSVWKVTKGDAHIFLGGTVHLLAEGDHPLPLEYAEAYKGSDALVFETDIANSSTVEFQQKLVRAMSFQDGGTLKGALSKSTYENLAQHLESRGSHIGAFSAFTPTGAALMTVMMEYQRIGLMPQWGVDITLQKQALADGKGIGQLESLEEQIAFIANMGKGQEDQMIVYTLRDLAMLPEYFDKLKGAWRSGDLKAIEKVGLLDIKRDFPSVYEDLIVRRNKNWAPQIAAMFKTKEVEFVLVGAAHLAGEDGVIHTLTNEGYSVSKL